MYLCNDRELNGASNRPLRIESARLLRVVLGILSRGEFIVLPDKRTQPRAFPRSGPRGRDLEIHFSAHKMVRQSEDIRDMQRLPRIAPLGDCSACAEHKQGHSSTIDLAPLRLLNAVQD